MGFVRQHHHGGTAESGFGMTIIDARFAAHGAQELVESDFGALLGALVVDVAKRHGVEVRAQIDHSWAVPVAVRGVILHVVAEATTNAVLHAHASSITVTVTVDGGQRRVRVCDDGDGFNQMIRPPGQGLIRMRSSAAAVGAAFCVRSVRRQGTTVELSFG